MIDFLIVGAGIYGATIARCLTNYGYKCLIIDKRNHIGGNIYSQKHNDGYYIHKYGAHIFHTNNSVVIDFCKKYSDWKYYNHNVIATDNQKIYHLPFNMNTYNDIFGVKNPEEAYNIINNEISNYISNHNKCENLEDKAISMIGTTIYEKLIKNYTEKQWGCSCKELSPDIISRLPLRYNFDNNYFNDEFQGIPMNGYEEFVKNIIGDIPYILNTKFSYNDWKIQVQKMIIYCGPVDELLDYELGELKWRSLRFENKTYIFNGHNGQGTPVLNNVSTDKETRYIEHMWFMPHKIFNGIESIITTEYPDNWERGKECYYAINNKETNSKYNEYCNLLLAKMPNIMLGGRLGKYKYYDMDDSILDAINDAENIFNQYEKY